MILSTHMVNNRPSLRRFSVLFWPPWALGTHIIYIYLQGNTCTDKVKIKESKNKAKQMSHSKRDRAHVLQFADFWRVVFHSNWNISINEQQWKYYVKMLRLVFFPQALPILSWMAHKVYRCLMQFVTLSCWLDLFKHHRCSW